MADRDTGAAVLTAMQVASPNAAASLAVVSIMN